MTQPPPQPACKCSHPYDAHDVPRDPPSNRGPNTARCRNPICGCMRYRPEPPKGA